MNTAEEIVLITLFCVNSSVTACYNSIFSSGDSRDEAVSKLSSTMLKELMRFYTQYGKWPEGLIESLHE